MTTPTDSKELLMGKVLDRLISLEDELKGLASLFQSGKREIPLRDDEFYGIGQLLRRLSGEASSLSEILRESDILEE
ncbi:MAG: hypothetical protein OXB88_01535 [Bacteriovoracales bacterium]|nr:hypothetical protein [Bacteriovoracales bacterium]